MLQGIDLPTGGEGDLHEDISQSQIGDLAGNACLLCK